MRLTDARTNTLKRVTDIRDDLPQSNMLVKEAFDQHVIPYLKKFVKSPNSLGIIKNIILPKFGHFPISKITTMDAQKFVYELDDLGYAAETIRKILLVAKTLYKELIKHRLVIFNPFDNLYRPKVSNICISILTQEQRHPFIECCIQEQSVFGDYILLLLLSGLRSSECARIKLKDITEDYQFLNLPSTKAGVPQQIVVNAFAKEVLKRRATFTWNEYLFPSPIKTNTHISSPRGSLDRIKKRMAERGFDISELTLHALRRTFASTCAEVTGGDLNMVAQQIRHSSIHVLKRYVHRQRNDVIAASEATAKSLMTPIKSTNK